MPSGTEGLLSAAQGLLSAAQGLLSAAQGPPLGGTGPPLSGTRASSRYRGLPQSPQHRGVGPFGTVSLLPTQGPPILSAQRTVPTSIEGLLSAQGPPPDTGASSNPLSTEDLPAQRASSRHRGLLSAAQGPPLSGTRASSQRHRGPPLGTGASVGGTGPPLSGTGPPLSGTRASSRHRGLPQSSQHRGVGPFGTVSLATSRHIRASFNPLRTEKLPAQRVSSRYRGLLEYYLTNHRELSGTVGLLRVVAQFF